MKSLNNLRQIALATHQVGDSIDGFVGGVYNPDPPTLKEGARLNKLYQMYASPIDLAFLTINGIPLTGDDRGPIFYGIQPLLVSPADPSITVRSPEQMKLQHSYGGPTSYAYNMTAFVGPVKFPVGIPDGTSNTIAYCERYYARFSPPDATITVTDFETGMPVPLVPFSFLNFAFTDPKYQSSPYSNNRRASFADAGWGDVVPLTNPETHVTRPSRPGATFRVRPPVTDSDLFLPQTPFNAGLPVAMFDGSVRTVRPSISPEMFWGAVTPNGGEVASLD